MTRAQRAVKRAFDVVVATLALAVLLPFLPLVALSIKLDSPGPVFYVATRCGQGRRPFGFCKLRSMVEDADRRGPVILTRAGDDRVTRVGRILRALKIDELPQLWNVLKGDMSIVGPRPEVFEVVDRYYRDEWDAILAIRPGLTCLLQVAVYPDFTAAHGGVEDPLRHYVEQDLPVKLRLDREYVERASLGLDLLIIAQTLYCIVTKSFRGRRPESPQPPAAAEGRGPWHTRS